ncbi:porcupine [Aphelenchoides avenae]|nr:porcupine [Aphelenchus avenae]
MPGLHTFYDGSMILEPLADRIGVEVDKLNLVLCQFISIPLAIAYYTLLPPKLTSRNVRLAYPLVIGLSMCYFCYGNAIKHVLANAGVCYALMMFSPTEYVHKIVFIFSMGYLIFIHWYRWYLLTSYSVDITGPFMVVVQRTTTIAFSMHDGRVKRDEELNEIQKKEAIREFPPVLDYFSYMFHFQTVFAGPLSFYTDYQKFIDGENFGPDLGLRPTAQV